jgi:hypothetical protein
MANTPDTTDSNAAIHQSVHDLLLPLARLCLAKGIPFAATQELLKRAFVDAAREGTQATRDISRVSTATGINRREVARLTSMEGSAPALARRSPATQVFTRWLSDRRLRARDGSPKPLRRQGPAPSFEALAQSITRDVHPRSLLEDICRLGLATFDEETDTVILVRDAFVPRDDERRLYRFLGSNVGDHMSAAVENVLSDDGPVHLEQAVFADQLSEESLAAARKLVRAQWKELLASVVPELEALIKADADSQRVADRRVRIGMYSYHSPMQAETTNPEKNK